MAKSADPASQDQVHPLRDQLKLAGWTVSCNSSLTKAFHKTLLKLFVSPASNIAQPGTTGAAGAVLGRLIYFKHL